MLISDEESIMSYAALCRWYVAGTTSMTARDVKHFRVVHATTDRDSKVTHTRTHTHTPAATRTGTTPPLFYLLSPPCVPSRVCFRERRRSKKTDVT